MEAALELFLEGGIAATSFEAIAERTGASRSSIYRRWRTRDDIVLAAIDRYRAQQEAGAQDWSSRPVAEVTELFTRLTVAAVTDRRSMALLRQMLALDRDSPIKRRYWATVIQPRRETFARMIVTAREQQLLPEGLDPYLLQDVLAGALAYQLLMNPEPLGRTAAERYVRRLLDGLGLLSRATTGRPSAEASGRPNAGSSPRRRPG